MHMDVLREIKSFGLVNSESIRQSWEISRLRGSWPFCKEELLSESAILEIEGHEAWL
jgi:hypothetical protein